MWRATKYPIATTQKFSTLDWLRSLRRRVRQVRCPQPIPKRLTTNTWPARAAQWARLPTCPRNRCEARKWMAAATCSPSWWCSTKSLRAPCHSGATLRGDL